MCGFYSLFYLPPSSSIRPPVTTRMPSPIAFQFLAAYLIPSPTTVIKPSSCRPRACSCSWGHQRSSGLPLSCAVDRASRSSGFSRLCRANTSRRNCRHKFGGPLFPFPRTQVRLSHQAIGAALPEPPMRHTVEQSLPHLAHCHPSNFEPLFLKMIP